MKTKFPNKIAFLILFFTLISCYQFNEDDFKKEFSIHFRTQIPSNTEYISTGVAVTMKCGEDFYKKFLAEVKDGYTFVGPKENFIDYKTGDTIKYSFTTGYSGDGENYKADFFDDNNTVRIIFYN